MNRFVTDISPNSLFYEGDGCYYFSYTLFFWDKAYDIYTMAYSSGVEQVAHNHLAGGSNPSAPTK